MPEGLTAEGWRTLLDGVTDHTIGVEEELMLLDPETLDLLPEAARVRAELGDTVPMRTELPAAQLETASPVCTTIAEAARSLTAARRALKQGTQAYARVAAAGTHAFADPEGALIDDPKYASLIAEFPWVLPRQLVFGLQVHVAVRGADRALAVHNALRSHLPDVAALAGNAPLHAGRDTGLASLRPKLSELPAPPGRSHPPSRPGRSAPRSSAGAAAAASSRPPARRGGSCAPTTSSARSSCACPTPRRTRRGGGRRARVRGRPGRVARRAPRRRRASSPCTTTPGSPRTAGARCATASTARCSTSTAASRSPRASACSTLIDAVAPAAERLGGAAELEHARALAARNGAERQRALAAERGPRGVVEWLAGAFAAMRANVGAQTWDAVGTANSPRIGKAPWQ